MEHMHIEIFSNGVERKERLFLGGREGTLPKSCAGCISGLLLVLLRGSYGTRGLILVSYSHSMNSIRNLSLHTNVICNLD